MKRITDRQFTIDTEYCELKGTVTLDITDDVTEVISVGFEGEGAQILHALEDFVREYIPTIEEYDAHTLRIEEKNWDQSEDADAERKERSCED